MALTLRAVQRELVRMQEQVDASEIALQDAEATETSLTGQIDELTMLNAELGDRLGQAGVSVEHLAAERTDLAKALEDAAKKLKELTRQSEALEARQEEVEKLEQDLHASIQAGTVVVAEREGRVVLVVDKARLFEKGKTNLTAEGKKLLDELAKSMKGVAGRHFQIAGYATGKAGESAHLPSRFHQTATEAVIVARYLSEAGVPAERLSAAGMGEAASRESVELVLVPKKSELALPLDDEASASNKGAETEDTDKAPPLPKPKSNAGGMGAAADASY